MKKLLCQLSRFALLAALSLVAFSSCEDGKDEPQIVPTLPEPDPTPGVVNDPVVYKNAILIYYGTESDDEESSFYRLSLYTDMEIDDMGNPVGPGQLLRLDINASLFDKTATEFPFPVGTYKAADASQFDLSPFTFIEGYKTVINLPTGAQEIYFGSFFGDVPAGTAVYNPDFLGKGSFNVSKKDDKTYRLEGILLGSMNMKRKFVYEGELKEIVRKTEEVPLSTLTSTLELNDFTNARLRDKGNSFWLSEKTCRTLELRLVTAGINFDQWSTPSGEGRMLKMEIFVPWSVDVNKGVPAGTYSMAPLVNESGLKREHVSPGYIYPGIRSSFETPSGSWYQEFGSQHKLINYACARYGTLTVERDGDAHKFTIDFLDTNENRPNKIVGEFSCQEPIPVFE